MARKQNTLDLGIVMLKSRLALSGIALLLAFWTASAAYSQSEKTRLTEQHWFEIRSPHFNTYSCGPTQDVARLACRLEQFREAYGQLAGTQAVASPPIIVMAFPDLEAMKPFLPLYQGQPANLVAFFDHGSDENLIAMPLAGAGQQPFEIIFHEYTHLLLRHNERFWPIWLKEGMADIYSTFEVTGSHNARIGKPIAHHLHLLKQTPWLPFDQLFTVTRDSPQYNEREHQGIFYAESWLLAHYLMLGNNPERKAHFGQVTTLLRQGQVADQAFTNSFQVSLPTVEQELRAYLQREHFVSLDLVVKADLTAPWGLVTRSISPAEVSLRLGDQLMRVGRLEEAAAYFSEAQKQAPTSPLGYEGMGLLAAARHQPDEAVSYLRLALDRGSRSFLAHFTYARARFQLTADPQGRYTTLPKDSATEIRAELERSLSLMPDFGPAHHLLGILQLLQDEDLQTAQQHLERAIKLEPENVSYLLSLAQAQKIRHDPAAARHTLEQLRLPYVGSELRTQAEQMLQELDHNARN
jgi:tetratricopeptide (TPR) repeat protein